MGHTEQRTIVIGTRTESIGNLTMELIGAQRNVSVRRTIAKLKQAQISAVISGALTIIEAALYTFLAWRGDLAENTVVDMANAPRILKMARRKPMIGEWMSYRHQSGADASDFTVAMPSINLEKTFDGEPGSIINSVTTPVTSGQEGWGVWSWNPTSTDVSIRMVGILDIEVEYIGSSSKKNLPDQDRQWEEQENDIYE